MEIQIETIHLKGVSHFDGERFGAALEGELGRLLAQAAPASGFGRVEGIDLEMPAGADSAAIGVQVALAIYAGLSGISG